MQLKVEKLDRLLVVPAVPVRSIRSALMGVGASFLVVVAFLDAPLPTVAACESWRGPSGCRPSTPSVPTTRHGHR
jgi:hypothetical protein